MSIDTAKNVSDEDEECAICESVESYVLYDGDKMCTECGHAPGGDEPTVTTLDAWETWWDHRAARYSGFHGEDRIKFVGGFVRPYVSEN